jgi:hypothetical protein
MKRNRAEEIFGEWWARILLNVNRLEDLDPWISENTKQDKYPKIYTTLKYQKTQSIEVCWEMGTT